MFDSNLHKVACYLTVGKRFYLRIALSLFIFLQIFLWLPKTVHASQQIEYYHPAYYNSACHMEAQDGTAFLQPMVNPIRNQKTNIYAKKPSYQQGSITQNLPSDTSQSTPLSTLFEKYGSQYNIDPGLLHKIARCESGFNPQALSPSGKYAGLFQFVDTTWIANRKSMGLDPNPQLRFDAEEATKTAAYKISRDGTGAWPVCG